MFFPYVSIIIPVYNEEKYIEECIRSLDNQSYPKDKLEILVVDGMSTDRTLEKVNKLSNELNINIKVIENTKRIAPTAMNLGIKNSTGDIIIRIDGHAYAHSDFISTSVKLLREKEVACVGGPIETISQNFVGESIALAMACPFGVGNSLFRYSKKEKYVDTLAFGAYKREVFEKIGCFDEELVRNQDDELNFRLIKSGEKILLSPKIKSYYYSRSSLKKLWKQYFQYGYWKVRVIQKHKMPSSIRQLVPMTFVISLLGSVILSLVNELGIKILLAITLTYLASSLFFSVKISYNKTPRFIAILPIIFFILHFSYGLGFINGIIDFLIRKKLVNNFHISR
ncbi:glycosyltransferase [Senegalia sp. (in: firmicutes)]|uniref:glycosyltransferase n=1 Tax=Senegalia sp. (in: firmicutes) TaxID=1924098 RepID=UPI003F9709DC